MIARVLRSRLGLILEVTVPVALVAAWWIASASSTSFFFPPLSEIVSAFRETWLFSHVASDVVPSMARLAAGFLIAILIAVPLGVLLSQSKLLWRAAEPIVEFLRALPGPALIPLGIVLVGIGSGMKIALIAFGCLFPILLTTMDGVAAIDPVLRDTVKSYRLSRRDRIRHVIVPAAMPQIFAGLRTSLALGLIMVVISEMVASENGVGYFVLQAQRSFDLPEMWAGTLLIGILGYALSGVLALVERRVLRWHRASKASALAS
jgi:ABC-type nitrate/sulfonate/bicarbonate transport system permease component